MLQQLVEFCTSSSGLFWLIFSSDVAIALAYFAIPITMAFVLRHRKEDIPYPWLWTLFVAFIVACGLTHVVHVWSAILGTQFLGAQAIINIVTAVASVGTAIAFALILPQIRMLPSPRQQREQLSELVTARTKDKDELILEINHRIGNQLQILSSIVSIESRRAKAPEARDILARLRAELDKMGAEHAHRSERNYLGIGRGAGDATEGAARQSSPSA